jgi:hypothetical protein
MSTKASLMDAKGIPGSDESLREELRAKVRIVSVMSREEVAANAAAEQAQIQDILSSSKFEKLLGTDEDISPDAPVQVERSLGFPEDCMYGRMGEWARSLGTPLGHAYPAMLGAYSFVPDLDSMCGCRLGVYVCIVAPVGGGKNTSLVRAIQVLGLRKGLDWKVTTASSDRGLMDAIGSKTEGRGKDKKTVPGPRKLLLRTNEMGATLKKAAIDGSVLSDMLCEVWDTGEWECRDKSGSSECDCRMSWVGGVPVDTDKPEQFAEAFGKFASRGLMSRMILGYHAGERFRHDGKEWTPTPNASETVLTGDDLYASLDKYFMWAAVRTVSPEAQRMYDAWGCPQDVDGRLRYNLMKVALLTASANHEGTVSPDCMAKAILFMDWQARLREVFKPSDAIGTPEAVLGEIIMRKFRSMPKSGQRGSLRSASGEIKWRRVAHDMKWAGYGAGVLDRAIKSLVVIGELEWGKTEKEDGSLKDNNRIVIVRWEGKK